MRVPWKKRVSADKAELSVKSFAFPYYVETGALRTLADSLGIELPITRESGSEQTLKAEIRGIGAQHSRRESSQSEGHVHLNVLAARLKQGIAERDVVDELGTIPAFNDQSILSAAMDQLENMPQDDADTVRGRLERAYNLERQRAIAAATRAQLRQVAVENRLVILRGTFKAVPPPQGSHCETVRLTHLEPAEVVFEAGEPRPAEERQTVPEMPMPEELGIQAMLPAVEALTPAGAEVLRRGTSFYGSVIGHTVSFDETSGVLTFSAYALWGMPRPGALLDRARPYDFVERK